MAESEEGKSDSSTEQVFDQLAREIVRGSYRPGAELPTERALSTLLKVNRQVVRAALKRLEYVGLVRSVPDGGTIVLDYRDHAGLGLLPLIAAHPRGRTEAAMFWLSVLEVRASLGVDVARLCALRANRAKRQEIVALSQQMRGAADNTVLYEMQFRFWHAVQEGASNVVYRLAFNSVIEAARAMGAQAQTWSVRDVKRHDYYRVLAAAIAEGDEAKAERIAREQFTAGVEEFRRTIHGGPEPGDGKKKKAAGGKRSEG
jgi:GntR family transcriptional regulator, transcriptional repressor for pyruvate dehydrogenase complex